MIGRCARVLWRRCCRCCPLELASTVAFGAHGAGRSKAQERELPPPLPPETPHRRPARRRGDPALRLASSGGRFRSGSWSRARTSSPHGLSRESECARAPGGGAAVLARHTRTPRSSRPGRGAARLVARRRRRGNARVPARRAPPSLVRARRRPAGSRSSGWRCRRRWSRGRRSARRSGAGFELGRADYVHAAGALATLASSSSSPAWARAAARLRRRRTRFEPRSSSPISSCRRSSSSAARSCTSTRRLGYGSRDERGKE